MIGWMLAVALGGCGDGRSSPEAVFEKHRQAILDNDWNTLWELTDQETKSHIQSALELMRGVDEERKRTHVETLGISLGELARMTAREYFIAIMSYESRKENWGERVNAFRGTTIEKLEEKGDRAILTLKTPGGETFTSNLVRVHGWWYIDIGLMMHE